MALACALPLAHTRFPALAPPAPQAEYYRELLGFPNNYSITKRMAECLMYERAQEVSSWAHGCRAGCGNGTQVACKLL